VKINNWFEIDEKEYIWYQLQGYTIESGGSHVNWYLNGKLHRTDGAAVIYADGTTLEWYLSGEHYIEKDFKNENKL
jgi:hypothetical protein